MPTTPSPDAGPDQPEVILNLWYIYDNTGICYALRAKAYVATGTDEEKLELLRTLSLTDWRIAPIYPIPERHVVVTEFGEKPGLYYLGSSGGLNDLLGLFEEAIQEVQKGFPADCKLEIPMAPITCLTPLYLHDDHTMEVRPSDVKRRT